MTMRWPLLRILGGLLGAWFVLALLNQYAGILFLLCTAVAGWRLWLTTSGRMEQQPDASRPPPPRQRQDQASPDPSAAPVSRNSRAWIAPWRS